MDVTWQLRRQLKSKQALPVELIGRQGQKRSCFCKARKSLLRLDPRPEGGGDCHAHEERSLAKTLMGWFPSD
jgi:hypothetical protein